eukprot:1766022-Amphidinium_carterae.1
MSLSIVMTNGRRHRMIRIFPPLPSACNYNCCNKLSIPGLYITHNLSGVRPKSGCWKVAMQASCKSLS